MISTTSLSASSLVVLHIVLFHLLVPLHVFAQEWVTAANQSLTPYATGGHDKPTHILLKGEDGPTDHVDFYFNFTHPKKCLQNTMTCICLEMIPDEKGMIGNGDTSGYCPGTNGPGMNAWCVQWPAGTADWHAHPDTKLMRVTVEGADEIVTSGNLMDFPANWTLYLDGRTLKVRGYDDPYKSLLCATEKDCYIYNGLRNNTVKTTTNGKSRSFAIKAVGSDAENCTFTVQLQSKNAYVVEPPTTTTPDPEVFNPRTLPINATKPSVGEAGFPWWAILVTVAVLLFILVTFLYFLLVHLMWKRRCCFKNMDRKASTGSVSGDKSSDPKNKAAQSADVQAKKTQSKEAQPMNGNDKRAPAGHDGNKPQPMNRQQEDAVTRQQEGAVTRQQDVLADVDFDYINIGNVIDPESTSQSQRNTVRAKDDPLKRTRVEPSKEEPKMLQPIIAPEPSELTFSQALFNGQMSELRPTFFKAFIAITVVYVILVLPILAGWAVAFIMFPDHLGLGWAPVR